MRESPFFSGKRAYHPASARRLQRGMQKKKTDAALLVDGVLMKLPGGTALPCYHKSEDFVAELQFNPLSDYVSPPDQRPARPIYKNISSLASGTKKCPEPKPWAVWGGKRFHKEWSVNLSTAPSAA
jgi:hypothetical protein